MRPANYSPLSIVSFIERTASVYPEYIAYEYEEVVRSWKEVYDRTRKLAHALQQSGVESGETVSVLLPNVPAMYELHFGVPMMGGILNTLNYRLDARSIAFMLEHAESKILFYDGEFKSIVDEACSLLMHPPKCIVVADPGAGFVNGDDELEYETFLATGSEEFVSIPLQDEWDTISLNYTSGTTGDPKGVLYHHRGAFLNALNNALSWKMPDHSVYLWTLPMFHCNGWCFPWTLAAIAGKSILMRKVTAKGIFEKIAEKGITHLCGAPIIPTLIVNASQLERKSFSQKVHLLAAGGAHPVSVMKEMESLGIHTTLAYGLTETFGPAVYCAWHQEWDTASDEVLAYYLSRAGVRYHCLDALEVVDPQTNRVLPHDGKSVGEIVFRGNLVMKGYLKNKTSTEKAFAGGYFHSGDLGVIHPDGYLQITDRLKDIIISGGENIASIEVEAVLASHPDVAESAIVAMPHLKWGEVPCGFVRLKSGSHETEEKHLIEYCRSRLAHFKCPAKIVFCSDLPRTATGKVQKWKLREAAQKIFEQQ